MRKEVQDLLLLNVNLRGQIVDKFSAMWEHNDAAHRIEHFDEVEQCGLYLLKALGKDYDPKLVLFTAYFHDLFAWSRENHHLLSAEFIIGTDHPLIASSLDHGDRRLVSAACGEHRASYKGDFTYAFSELMNSADRGFPGDVSAMLERALEYRRSKGIHTDDAVKMRDDAIAHLKDKWGTGGYARFPKLYQEVFERELTEQRYQIDSL